MAVIEIFGAPQSVYVRATRLALEEKGVSYTLTPAAPHSPQILALNPFGKIPAMRHGTFELFESTAIIAYVDRTRTGPKLIPDDARLAARVLQWSSAINTNVAKQRRNVDGSPPAAKLAEGELLMCRSIRY